MYFIGEIHGEFNGYNQLITQIPESIQVGDFGIGFRKNPRAIAESHKFIHGNHDNPEECAAYPNYLGRYGVYKDIFFVSGAFSIDKKFRTIGIDWWENEELSKDEARECYLLYSKVKPEIVVSHDCPFRVSKWFGNISQTYTSHILTECLRAHKPKYWIFGHHHKNKVISTKETTFICLGIFSTMHLDEKGLTFYQEMMYHEDKE